MSALIPEQLVAGEFRRVDEAHPLDLYFGRDSLGNRALLLVTEHQVGRSLDYASFSVVSRMRGDRKWALLFILKDAGLERLFGVLCDDLVEASRPVRPNDGTLLWRTLQGWDRLLQQASTTVMSLAELRGLVGELILLEAHCMPKYGEDIAINAWKGPTGADQDFALPEFSLEVKTIHPNATDVWISSAEQLDCSANSRLVLAIVSLEDAAGTANLGSWNAVELCDRIRASIVSPSLARLFDLRLSEAGFLRQDELRNFHFFLRSITKYEIDSTMPIVRRSRLSACVGDVKWQLRLDAISQHRLAD